MACNKDCPCWGCTGRNLDCHAKCEKYAIWNEKNTKRREAEHKEKEISGGLYRQRRDSVGKALRHLRGMRKAEYTKE